MQALDAASVNWPVVLSNSKPCHKLETTMELVLGELKHDWDSMRELFQAVMIRQAIPLSSKMLLNVSC